VSAPVAVEADVEAALAGIWAEVLGVTPAPDDEFFASGGHSLAAIRLLARIRSALGVALDFGALQGRSRFAALVALVSEQRRLAPEPPFERLPLDEPGPLSFAQERFWLEQQAAPDSPRLHVPVAIRLSGALDADALEAAVRAVVDRHESLRTAIRDSGDGPRPVVLSTDALPWTRLDQTGQPEADLDVAMRAFAAEPFDLAAGLPVRVQLWALADDRHLLLLVAHHAAVDGVSLGLLGQEVAAAYAALRLGQAWTPAPLPCRYADLAAADRRALAEGAFDRDMAYWRDRLAGVPAESTLPATRTDAALPTFSGGLVRSRLSAPVAAALEALARDTGATPFMGLLAAFMALARRHGAPADMVVGTPVAGRHRLEAEALAGCFLNVLPVRAEVDTDMGFRTLLAGVREAAAGAYDHARAPFERVVADRRAPRRPDRPPVFQLVVAEVPAGAPALVGLEAELVPIDAGAQAYDVMLSLRAEPDGYALDWAYRADRYDHATVAAWAERFECLVADAVAAPDSPLGTLALGTGAIAPVEPAPPIGPDPLAAFEAQAARTPQAIALTCGATTWTYDMLREQVDGLAARLLALGVGPEQRVAICLPRGPMLVAAMLA
ncbi:MAG: condensation domain-containing protein, partial [Candidatus Sericytochromatia bacterium]